MATITETTTAVACQIQQATSSAHREPLKPTGALEKFEHFDVTPAIGREFPTINLKELLESPDSDELLKELAVTSMSRP